MPFKCVTEMVTLPPALTQFWRLSMKREIKMHKIIILKLISMVRVWNWNIKTATKWIKFKTIAPPLNNEKPESQAKVIFVQNNIIRLLKFKVHCFHAILKKLPRYPWPSLVPEIKAEPQITRQRKALQPLLTTAKSSTPCTYWWR